MKLKNLFKGLSSDDLADYKDMLEESEEDGKYSNAP